MAATQGLTGPAAAGHKSSQAGAQVAGLSGIWELLETQVGLPQVLTAFQRGEGEGWVWAERDEKKASYLVLVLGLAGGQVLKDLTPGRKAGEQPRPGGKGTTRGQVGLD